MGITHSPYKGLMPYTEEDADLFFGRDRDCAIITANLFASRLTILFGASGVGKSSVLQAGVAHNLRQKEGMAVVVFSDWHEAPLDKLRQAIQDEMKQVLDTDLDQEEAMSFKDFLTDCASRIDGQVVIILDQFEEYLLYHPGDEGPGSFVTEFARVVNSRDVPVSFLIAIREESLAKLDRFKGRIPQLFGNYLRLDHLDEKAAREAIEKPLEKVGWEWEDELVKAVIGQVRVGRIGLGEIGRGEIRAEPSGAKARVRVEAPFLQIVMTRLWNEEQAHDSRKIHKQTLDDLGGAEQIVRDHLDTSMDRLSSKQQAISAAIFHYLVTPSGTKIAQSAGDLAIYADQHREQIAQVLSTLAGPARLLRTVAAAWVGRERRYEVYHDSLAPAVLDWRGRYYQRQREIRVRRRARWALLGIGIFLVLVSLVIVLWARRTETTVAARETVVAMWVTVVAQRETVVATRVTAVAQEETAIAVTVAAQETAVAQGKTAIATRMTAVAQDEATVVAQGTAVAQDEATVVAQKATAQAEATVAAQETATAQAEATAVAQETAAAQVKATAKEQKEAEALSFLSDADQAILQGDYEQAIADCTRAIELVPDLAEAYYIRGFVYTYYLDEYEKAIADYDRAIELDPEYQWAYAHKGRALRKLGRYDEALATLDQAIQLVPEYAWAYRERGEVYSDRGEYERAIEDYDKAIELDPEYKYAYAHKGSDLRKLGRYDEALVALDQAIQLDPEYAWPYTERGLVYSDRGEYEQAIEEHDKAIELDPEYKWAYGNKGYALRKLGRYDEALAILDQAIRLDPGYVWAYNERGRVYRDRGEYELAIEEYDKAIELDAEYADAYFDRGLVHKQLGEKEKAIADFEEFLRLSEDEDLRSQVEQYLEELRGQ